MGKTLACAAIISAACAGCDLIGNGIVCTEQFVYGLNVTVTNGQTGEPIAGATLTVTEGDYTEIMEEAEINPGQYFGAGERAGTYTLTVEAQGFEPVTMNSIVVTADECHVIPVTRDIALTPK